MAKGRPKNETKSGKVYVSVPGKLYEEIQKIAEKNKWSESQTLLNLAVKGMGKND